MCSKKENHNRYKRVARRREKLAIANGVEEKHSKTMGRVARRGWGTVVVSTQTNEIY